MSRRTFRLIAAGLAICLADGAKPAVAQAYDRTIGDIREDGQAAREECERALRRCEMAMPIEIERGRPSARCLRMAPRRF
jgi:hypothetical protein